MPRPIALQLYSVREAAAADFFGVLRRVAQMGYQGVEFAGLHGKPASEVAKLLKDLGLKSVAAHGPVPTRESISQLVADGQALGYTRVVTGFAAREMESEDGVKACAEKLARGCEVARSAGLSLLMHNHWWEFDRVFHGRTPFELILSAAPSLGAELDLYWCAAAGKDVPAVVREWSERIRLLHVKDGDLADTQYHKAVGEGKAPVKASIQAAGKGLEWLIVELDACKTDMMEAVGRSVRWLVEQGLGKARK